MSPSPDDREAERDVLDALRRLVRLLREASRFTQKSVGISGAQLFVLHQLRDGQALSINELAAETLTHQSSVSVVVARLADEGLVKRGPAPRDARRVEAAITPKGRALLAKAPPVEQARLIEGLRAMPPAQRRALRSGMSAWIDAMGLTGDEPPMFFEPTPKRRASKKASPAKKEARRGRS